MFQQNGNRCWRQSATSLPHPLSPSLSVLQEIVILTVCVLMCVCHSSWVLLRGYPMLVRSLSLPCGTWRLNSRYQANNLPTELSQQLYIIFDQNMKIIYNWFNMYWLCVDQSKSSDESTSSDTYPFFVQHPHFCVFWDAVRSCDLCSLPMQHNVTGC